MLPIFIASHMSCLAEDDTKSDFQIFIFLNTTTYLYS